MKKNLLTASVPLIILVILFWTNALLMFVPAEDIKPEDKRFNAIEETREETRTEPRVKLAHHITNSLPAAKHSGAIEKISAYALSLLGKPYTYAGITPDGFDCSGFITHVYDKVGIYLPHSSAMQADEGIQVAKQEAKAGDLVIFTGTDPKKREPGHVGMVISSPGDTIKFVHSSSNGGVKISKVEGTGYAQRFLEVRRVL